MADIIARFKGDTTDLESKVKKASQSLLGMEQDCRKVAGTFEVVEQEQLDFVRALGQMDTSARNSRGQLRELTQSINDLTSMYGRLTDAEKSSEFGRALSQSIDEMTERAGQLKDVMADTAAAIQNAASDTRAFDQMAGGMSLLTSTMQVGQGAAKLLGINLGDNLEVMAKLQSAMAITNGLQTIQNLLQKQSALMQGVNAAKTALATAAQKLFAVATGEATVAQAAFNTVASMNPYVALAGLATAAITAVIGFTAATEGATAAMEDQETEAERLKSAHSEAFKRINSSVAETEVEFRTLQAEWKNLSTMAEKTEWLDKNKNKWSSWSFAINDVNDANRVFVENADAVIAAMKAIAEAEALKEEYKTSYKKKIAWENRDRSVATGDYYRVSHKGDRISHDEAKRLGLKPGVDYNRVGFSDVMLTDSGARSYSENSKRQAASRLSAETQRRDQEVNFYYQKWQEKEREAGRLTTAAGGGSHTPRTPSGSGRGHGGGRRGGHSGGGRSGGGGGNTNTAKPIPGSTEWYEAGLKEVREKLSKATDDAIRADLEAKEFNLEQVIKRRKEGPVSGIDWVGIAQDDNAINKFNLDQQKGKPLDTSFYSEFGKGAAQALLDEIQKLENYDQQNGLSDESKARLANLKSVYANNYMTDDEKKEKRKSRRQDVLDGAEQAVNGVAQVSDGLKGIGLDLGEGFDKTVGAIQSVFTVIQGVQSIVSAVQLILGINEGTQTSMLTTIAASTATDAIIPFHNGGLVHAAHGVFVPGAVNGGRDTVPALLSPGELVLNASQQQGLAQRLQGSGMGAMNLTATIKGSDIRLAMNNDSRRHGRGEYVTTRR